MRWEQRTKKPKSNPKPKATTTATSYVRVTEPLTKPNTNKEGEGRGRKGVSKALSVCSSLTVIAVLVSTDGNRSLPASLCRKTSALFSLSFSWTDKIWDNLNELTLRIYIFFVLCFP